MTDDTALHELLSLWQRGAEKRQHERLRRQANQGEIGVVIDGKYYGITDYAEE